MGSPNDSGRSLFVDSCSCSSCELAAARKLEHFHTAAERQQQQATAVSTCRWILLFMVCSRWDNSQGH